MDEIVPESGARFESMMREIDAGFVKNGVAIPARPLKALMAVGSRYKITMPLTKPFPGAPTELLRYAQLSESIHGVYTLPKHLDEKVARLHLDALGARLTELRPEQAAYLGIAVEGPYKPEHYRY